jgi:hypothetical protein
MKSAQREAQPYRFDHFRTSLLLKDMRFSKDSARPGDVLADHRLTHVDGTEVGLRELARDRPLVLVTGSLTCPITSASLPRLQELEERFRDDLAFAFVYVREAHPGGSISQAHTLEEKREYARLLQESNGVSWPVLVDDLDGSLHRALDTNPNSIHVVGADGRILFRALFADDPATHEALEAIAQGRSPKRSTGSAFLRPALKSVGHVHDVLVSAGKGAYADVARAAPPMALLGFASHILGGRRRPQTKELQQ